MQNYQACKGTLLDFIVEHTFLENQWMPRGALLAQLVERQTIDRKVADSNLTTGAALCLEQDTSSPLLSTGQTLDGMFPSVFR